MQQLVSVALLCLCLSACSPHQRGTRSGQQQKARVQLMTIAFGDQAERDFYSRVARDQEIPVDVIPPTETIKSRIDLYRDLLHQHSAHPDLYEIDVVWPAALADNLVDLTPFVKQAIETIDARLLNSYKVDNRLVALPTYLDVSLLYYRADLLRKYGFDHPPSNWGELTSMASVIQKGERSHGNHNFWGYVWQGASYEGLTCNAMEWQAAAGSPPFLDSQGVVHVRNKETLTAIKQAASWIGTISPPGEPYYREMDATNVWREGNAAFMRHWLSSYHLAISASTSAFRPDDVGVSSLPGGPGGHPSMLGGQAISISRYSSNIPLAAKGLLQFAAAEREVLRLRQMGSFAVDQNSVLQSSTIPGELIRVSRETILSGLIARPSLIAGERYPEVSKAYFTAINSVLTQSASTESAMQKLEDRLVSLGPYRRP